MYYYVLWWCKYYVHLCTIIITGLKCTIIHLCTMIMWYYYVIMYKNELMDMFYIKEMQAPNRLAFCELTQLCTQQARWHARAMSSLSRPSLGGTKVPRCSKPFQWKGGRSLLLPSQKSWDELGKIQGGRNNTHGTMGCFWTQALGLQQLSLTLPEPTTNLHGPSLDGSDPDLSSSVVKRPGRTCRRTALQKRQGTSEKWTSSRSLWVEL